MQRLVNHPYSKKEIDFVEEFKVAFEPPISLGNIESCKLDSDGRKYKTIAARHKTAHIYLKLFEGDGKINIESADGNFDISFFESMTHREQLLFPFKVVDMINKFDMNIKVNNSAGMSTFAKLIRLTISNALCSFLPVDAIEKLRLGITFNF